MFGAVEQLSASAGNESRQPDCLPTSQAASPTQWKLFAHASAAGKPRFTRYTNAHLGTWVVSWEPVTVLEPSCYPYTEVSLLSWAGNSAAPPTSLSTKGTHHGAGECFSGLIQCFNYGIAASRISCSVSNVHSVSPVLLEAIFLLASVKPHPALLSARLTVSRRPASSCSGTAVRHTGTGTGISSSEGIFHAW